MLKFLSIFKNLRRGLTSNHARLDPQSDDPLLRPLEIPCDPGDVADAIQWWASTKPGWSVQSRREENAWTTIIHLTRITRLLRFTDDIHVRLEQDGDVTHVDAESKSRWGKGDLGQNQRNLRELVSDLSRKREPEN